MIGKHKDIITIKGRAANVSDGYGGVVESFTTKWTGFAELSRVSGGRGIDAGSQVLDSTYEVTLRKNPTITYDKKDIVEYDGKTYGIVSIDDDADRFITMRLSVTE